MNAINANRQAALLGLYYYGEAHYRQEVTPPASLPADLRVVDPATAVDWLEHDREPGYKPIVRLALAELVSASAAFGTNLALSYIQRLAVAIGVDGQQIGDLIRRISGDDQAARANRYLQCYELAGGGGCKVRNFRLTAIFHDNVSDVTTSIEVNRQVADFTNGLDPRNWSATLPDVWEDSYEIVPGTLDGDRRKSPPATKINSPVPTMLSLFEKADWSSQLNSPFAYWRTILQVQLNQALGVANPFIRFDYSLFECLENEFLGDKQAGGIDVDHGHGSCEAVAGDPTWSKLEAQKVVRFTQPNLAINSLTFVFLIIWFSYLILTSACA